MGYIYMLTNTVDGMAYIGQTIRPIHERFDEHQKPSNCVLIYRAIQKHGWDKFIADYYECPDEDLNKHERWMIRVTGSLAPGGYNLTEGGSNGRPSEITRQKMSEAHIGKIFTEEHKQHLSEAKSGPNNPMYGKTLPEEIKKKIGEAKLKKVYQYDLNGTFVRPFGSVTEAAEHLKRDRSNISSCANGKLQSAYKFRWSYEKKDCLCH